MRRTLGLMCLAILAGFLGVLGTLAWHEAHTSQWQARLFSERAREMTFAVAPGASDSIYYPSHGPFDERMGYALLPSWQSRLAGLHFEVEAQARMSPAMANFADRGFFVPFREKVSAGLSVDDCSQRPLYRVRFPQRTYQDFSDVPALLVNSLLFIENRELLSSEHSTKNPAVEWDRLVKAALGQAKRRAGLQAPSAGGSTLATQIEKFRHSPNGRTESPRDKLTQMVSASMRAYLEGPDTTGARRRLVVDYLNTVPLAGWPGYGEVNGIGDGLWVWYGRDFAEVNALLLDETAPTDARARAYKQALSLLVSQRRPAGYLSRDIAELENLTNAFVRLSAQAGLIDADLQEAALKTRLERRSGTVAPPRREFIEGKAVTAVRSEIAGLLGIRNLYELDRFDLEAGSTLDQALQTEVTARLRAIATPEGAAAAGLLADRLLAHSDPSKVTYSFTLIERAADANAVRVQVDTLDQPLDINSGIKLDLGSTAKLRTLVTYLESVAALHSRWSQLTVEELGALQLPSRDVIGRWSVAYLIETPVDRRSLDDMLDASLERQYSASPDEKFFTGGGLHTFNNFDSSDDARTMSIREALDRSVNLVFVRLMRDVVARTVADLPGTSATLLEDPNDPRRQEYLKRFADREGSQFLARFYRKHAGRPFETSRAAIVNGLRPTPRRLAAIYRSLDPDASEAGFAQFLAQSLPAAEPDERTSRQLYEALDPGRIGWQDRGYIAGVHPLELWLVAYLREHPAASLPNVLRASAGERQEVYAWLFRTRSKQAQDQRIREMIEADAFKEILAGWRRLGFPFETMTPSYGAALGSSGDRPVALAELMGILINDGRRMPTIRVDRLVAASGTPYETRFRFQDAGAVQQVLPVAVARTARNALATVVQRGTAKRVAGILKAPDGTVLVIGGKTGTGDHRAETFGRGGALVASRVVSRSGTFVFYLGDRYFGTVTAYVTGPDAGQYEFTSALPTQILKSLMPVLQAAIDRPSASDTSCGTNVRRDVPTADRFDVPPLSVAG